MKKGLITGAGTGFKHESVKSQCFTINECIPDVVLQFDTRVHEAKIPAQDLAVYDDL